MKGNRSKARAFARWSGWALLVLGVLTGAAWFASGWYGAAISFSGKEAVAVNRGCLNIEWARPTDIEYVQMRFGRFEWGPTSRSGWNNSALMVGPPRAGHRVLYFPLWWVVVPAVLVGALLVRIGREIPRGLCPHCRYDLSGLPRGSPCPECGRARAGVA